MAIISLGKINKNLLIPIIGGLIKTIFNIVLDLISSNKKKKILENPFVLSINTELGMILSFIPYIILKYRTKKKTETNNYIQNKNKKSKLLIKYVYYDIYEKNRYFKFKYILLVTIIDFSQTILIYTFCPDFVYNLWIFDIIFISLFSYFILKTKFYIHQYLSMIIIIIFGIALNIIVYYKNEDNQNDLSIFELIMKSMSEFFFCLNIVLNKYIMEKYFCTAYEICIWEGIINLFLFIILLFILSIFKITINEYSYPDNFFEYYEQFNLEDLLITFVIIFVSLFYNMSLLITCDKFTPCHILIIMIIHECYYYVKIDENLLLNIIGFFILLLMFIMFLFFTEIIELNLFGLSKNTKKNIGIRADSDSSLQFTNDYNLDDPDLDDEDEENEENEELNETISLSNQKDQSNQNVQNNQSNQNE